jgi:hypothetical protein
MTRDAFGHEFARRLRFVLQKHEREMAIRDTNRPLALVEANLNLDAAIAELSDFVFDVLDEKAPLFPAG